MIKFIHTSDVHLDSPLHRLDAYEGAPVNELRQATRRAFENLVQIAVTNKVDFVLIAGDLFDGDWKDYNTGLYLVGQTHCLHEAGIPVFIAAGNHDAASRISKALRWPANVHLFPSHKPTTFKVPGLNVAIHGQSYNSPSVIKDLSEAYPPPVNNCFNIGLLHTCLTGRKGHEPYAPCSLTGLKAKGYDYWALGHIHSHEIVGYDPMIVFSGNIQGRHIRETGPKGCVQVTVDEHDVPAAEFVELDVMRWHVLKVNVNDIEDAYELVDRFSQDLKVLICKNQSHPMVVRVILKGNTTVHDQIVGQSDYWINEIRSAAMTAGSGQIWVEKIIFQTTPPIDDNHVKQDGGAIAELIHYLDELDRNQAQLLDLSKYFHDIAKKLPRDLTADAEAVDFSNPKFLQTILSQTRSMLLRKLMSHPKSDSNFGRKE
jgi:DNA repair exonuclease SbcCD nuclease subunit